MIKLSKTTLKALYSVRKYAEINGNIATKIKLLLIIMKGAVSSGIIK